MPLSRFITIVGNRPVIDPGSLRHQVSIESPLTSTDPIQYGGTGALVTYSPFATARAAMETLRATDVVRSGQTSSQLYIMIVMWYQPGILSSMRVVGLNGIYSIQGIENVLEMNLVLELTCFVMGDGQ